MSKLKVQMNVKYQNSKYFHFDFGISVFHLAFEI